MRAAGRTRRFSGQVCAGVLVTAAVLGQAERVSAQVPTVRAYLDPPEVGPEQSVSVVLELSGVRDFHSVSVPVDLGMTGPDGLPWDIIVSAGPQRGAQGGTVYAVRYVILQTPDPGSHRIGPLRVAADGHVLETEPLTLVVAASDDVSVRVRADPPRVKRGDNFELIVEVLGGGRMTHVPELPDVFDYAEYTGSSGGSTDSFSYRMRATAAGELVIPPIRVRLADGTYETEPVRLFVTDEPRAVNVRATIHSGSIWVGGEFVVRVEVDGVSELDSEPVPPATDGFAEFLEPNADAALLPLSPLRSLGERFVERHFRFRAVAAGRFEIGPFRILAAGRTLETDPIPVVVAETPTADPEAPVDALFAARWERRAEVPVVYVNEPVIMSFAILHRQPRSPDVRTGTVSWPSLDGLEPVALTSRTSRSDRQADVGGRRYSVLPIRRVAVFPRVAGDIAIGPASVEVQVSSAQRFLESRRPRTPRFTSVILTSEPVALDVLPLPEAGRPESFRGHVGTLEITSWADRTRMKVGDTLTFQVEVDVQGYMRGLPEPEIDFPEIFEVSSLQIRDSMPESGDGLSGQRTYIYRLVAVAEGARDIPAVEMSYFDPETEGYGVSRGRPFTITVVSAGGEAR